MLSTAQDTLCAGELKTLGSPSTGTVKPPGQDVLWMLWQCSDKGEEPVKAEMKTTIMHVEGVKRRRAR